MELSVEQKRAIAKASARARLAAQGSTKEPGDWQDAVSAGFTAGVNGIPFVGDKILAGLNQAKSFVHTNLMNDPMTADQVSAENKSLEAANPVAATVGSIAGPTLALAPLGATATGARLLGMSGGMLSRIGLGMGSGAVIAGGDTLARGGSGEDALRNAELGGALGAALPAAGGLIKGAWRGMTGTAFDPAEKALARAIGDDKIPVHEIQTRLAALGPDAVLADLGPNLQRQAGALASLPGPAQQTVRDALMQRAEGTNSRIISDTNAALGPAPVPSHVEAGIQANRDALGPEYRAAFRNARAVDTQPLADNLDSEIVNMRGDAQRALRQVRGMLDIEGAPGNLDPHPYTLFQVRNAIDGMLETEVNTKVIGALTNARRQVDGILAQSVPGLKTVDAKLEELARQSGALGRGQQTLDSGRTAVRPAELQAEMTTAAVPERGVGPSAVPFRLSQGARAEIERIIGTTANDLNALKTALKGDGSWNRDRLASLFGQDKADRLLHILDREKTFDATNRIVTSNSETAARTAAQAEVDAGSPKAIRDLTLTGIAATLAQKGANLGAHARRTGTNARIADALMSRQPQQRVMSAVSRALIEREKRGLFAPAAVPLAITVNGGRN